jgi:hypothetical protein
MRADLRKQIVFWAAALAAPGCAGTHEARYVYQDGQYGVVAIPENTSQWPHHYREQAEGLMAHHFPQGYVIVRAEEVVEGSRTLTRNKAGTAEIAPQGEVAPLSLLRRGGSVGRTQADTTSIKECRIIYKKVETPDNHVAGSYAPEPSLSPVCYVDPNASARKKDDKPPAKDAIAKQDPPRAAGPPG